MLAVIRFSGGEWLLVAGIFTALLVAVLWGFLIRHSPDRLRAAPVLVAFGVGLFGPLLVVSSANGHGDTVAAVTTLRAQGFDVRYADIDTSAEASAPFAVIRVTDYPDCKLRFGLGSHDDRYFLTMVLAGDSTTALTSAQVEQIFRTVCSS